MLSWTSANASDVALSRNIMDSDQQPTVSKDGRLKTVGALLASVCGIVITIANVQEAISGIRKGWAYLWDPPEILVTLEKSAEINYVRGSDLSESVRITNKSHYIAAEVRIVNIRLVSVESRTPLELERDSEILLDAGEVHLDVIKGQAPDKPGNYRLVFDVVARSGLWGRKISESVEVGLLVWHEYPIFQLGRPELFDSITGDSRVFLARGYLSVGTSANKGLKCYARLKDQAAQFKGLLFPAIYPESIGHDRGDSRTPSVTRWSTRPISAFVSINVSLMLEIDGNTSERRLLDSLTVDCASVI